MQTPRRPLTGLLPIPHASTLSREGSVRCLDSTLEPCCTREQGSCVSTWWGGNEGGYPPPTSSCQRCVTRHTPGPPAGYRQALPRGCRGIPQPVPAVWECGPQRKRPVPHPRTLEPRAPRPPASRPPPSAKSMEVSLVFRPNHRGGDVGGTLRDSATSTTWGLRGAVLSCFIGEV